MKRDLAGELRCQIATKAKTISLPKSMRYYSNPNYPIVHRLLSSVNLFIQFKTKESKNMKKVNHGNSPWFDGC